MNALGVKSLQENWPATASSQGMESKQASHKKKAEHPMSFLDCIERGGKLKDFHKVNTYIQLTLYRRKTNTQCMSI